MPYATRRLYKNLVQVYFDANSTFEKTTIDKMKQIVQNLGGILVQKSAKATHIITHRPLHYIQKYCKGCTSLDLYRENVKSVYKIFVVKPGWLKQSDKKGCFVDETKYLYISESDICNESKRIQNSRKRTKSSNTSDHKPSESNSNSNLLDQQQFHLVEEKEQKNTGPVVNATNVEKLAEQTQPCPTNLINSPQEFIPLAEGFSLDVEASLMAHEFTHCFPHLTFEGIFNFGFVDDTKIPTNTASDILTEIFSISNLLP